MNKDYLFKVLYDSGVEKEYECVDIDDITFANLMATFSESYFKNAITIAKLPTADGGVAMIDVSKTAYVEVSEIKV